MDFSYFQIITRISESISKSKIIELKIGLKEVYFGTIANFNIKINKICDKCKGTGYIKTNEKCALCDGYGKIRQITKIGNISIIDSETCPRCLGTGRVIKKCDCDNGKITELEDTKLNIPPGIENNELILIRNKDRLNPAIYAKIKIVDKLYKINGLDLNLNLSLPYEYYETNKEIIIEHPLRNLKFKAKELIDQEKTIVYGFGLINKKHKKGDLHIITHLV